MGSSTKWALRMRPPWGGEKSSQSAGQMAFNKGIGDGAVSAPST